MKRAVEKLRKNRCVIFECKDNSAELFALDATNDDWIPCVSKLKLNIIYTESILLAPMKCVKTFSHHFLFSHVVRNTHFIVVKIYIRSLAHSFTFSLAITMFTLHWAQTNIWQWNKHTPNVWNSEICCLYTPKAVDGCWCRLQEFFCSHVCWCFLWDNFLVIQSKRTKWRVNGVRVPWIYLTLIRIVVYMRQKEKKKKKTEEEEDEMCFYYAPACWAIKIMESF